ncbi:peroxidase family protein [Aliishimia ponticola]|nr:peroxidase family protein [Aliishimia ponticola]
MPVLLALAGAMPVQAGSISAFIDDYAVKVAAGLSGPAVPALPPNDILSRLAPATYADGAGALVDRGNPRDISNALSQPAHAAQDELPPLSNLGVAMLQFLASHETAHTKTGSETINIPVPADDPVAQAGGGAPVMLMDRSLYTEVDGVREQTNALTHIFDGSTVYGSDMATTMALRSLDGTGRMKTGPDGGLPMVDGRPVAGDGRVAENPSLQSLHTLFVLEHNRLADEIAAACAAQGLTCTGDQIFEGARHLVAAEQEKVFYDELLPVFLGTDDLASLLPDPTIVARIDGMLTEFSAAAGRIGHTMVPDTIRVQAPGGAAQDVPLADCFFNMACLLGASLDDQLFGLSVQPSMAIDTVIDDTLRNAQVPAAGASFLIDLYATNINRGRDHGLPDYLTLRELLGFDPAPIEDLLPAFVLDAFPDYLTTGVDAIVGLFAEIRVPTQYMGDTARALWAAQFLSIQNDHSWFDPAYGLGDFLDGVTMAGLIVDNTGITAAQLSGNVFVAPVPLPAPGLLLLGAGGLLLARRRRV